MRFRLPVIAALLAAPAFVACASRVDRMERRYSAGDHQKVVDRVARWEAQGTRRDVGALRLVRDRSALALADAAGNAAALTTFRETYPESTLLGEALTREYDVALAEAQAEGTSAAFSAYMRNYPASSHTEQVRTLEESVAFEEATIAGTAESIERFVATHPGSELAASAWTVVAARTPGVHLLGPRGGPVTLPSVPVASGRIRFAGPWPASDAFPNVVVNLPGAGRGTTSEWWRLVPLWDAGGAWVIGEVAPAGERIASMLDIPAPRSEVGLLSLVLPSGANATRVARTRDPLILPGSCVGQAHFAFILEHPGAGSEAFPFAVDCAGPISLARAAAAPTAALYSAIEVAERGDLAGARTAWDRAAKLDGAAPLFAWLSAHSSDPRGQLLDLRPAAGDVLVWRMEGGRPVTRWMHPGEAGAVELGRRDGMVVAAGKGLWTTTRLPPIIPGACAIDTLTDLRRGAAVAVQPGIGVLLGSVGPFVMIRTHAPEGCPLPPGPATGFVAFDLSLGEQISVTTPAHSPSVPEAEVEFRAANETAHLDAIHLVAARPSFTPDLTMRYQFAKPARCRTCGDDRWSEGTVSVEVTGATPPELTPWQPTPALVRSLVGNASGWSVVRDEPAENFRSFR